jgi:hypothetical protein
MPLPALYQFFAFVYAVYSCVWFGNTIRFLNFRVPLHTLFHFLPIISGVSLWFSNLYWTEAQFTDTPATWKIWVISFLEFLFYTLTLVAISFACAGFCIYRQKFFWYDTLEIIAASALVVGSMLCAQLVSDIKEAFFLLGIICFGILWFLKQGIISVVVLIGVIRQMQSDSQVIAKVSLARNFVVSSFLTVFVTLLISSVIAGLDAPKVIASVFLEVGMLFNSALNLHFFLLRDVYAGKGRWGTERIRYRKAVVMMDPTRASLVMLSQTNL